MTIMFVFVALIAANVVYSIYDSRNCEAAEAMREFYRIEYKKTFSASHNEQLMLSTIR